jgi:hypothetical protein
VSGLLPPFIEAMAELEAYGRANGWKFSEEGHAGVIRALIREHAETEALFDLRWKADRRAIEAWQAAHPGNEMVWPNHVDLVTWLMDQHGS